MTNTTVLTGIIYELANMLLVDEGELDLFSVGSSKREDAVILLGDGQKIYFHHTNIYLLWDESGTYRLEKIEFEKMDGQNVFDLPTYLDERKISYILHPLRPWLEEGEIEEGFDGVCHEAILSPNGHAEFRDENSDALSGYSFYAFFEEKGMPVIDGKKVYAIRLEEYPESLHTTKFEDIAWELMENPLQMSQKELEDMFEKAGVKDSKKYLSIECEDGTVLESRSHHLKPYRKKMIIRAMKINFRRLLWKLGLA
ncbi:MAG: hypothetical protein ACI4HI_14725 [Lachnospiraceae bacterium]